ncbi:MAG: DUF2288 domain-containing protein [Deltaproteobacteria bacterium]|nr:DUF2288 domain-containing protein [Deltaproteobacteria bacterium]
MQQEQELREKLSGEMTVATWKGLIPDMLDRSLFFVSLDLDLVEVGVTVALDRTSEVRQWLESGCLSRPNSEQIGQWEATGSLFRFIIVAPFVFFQEYRVPDCS